MQRSSNQTTFGRRKEPHTIIIAKGDSVRHFTVRPWMAALIGCAVATLAVGYLLATTYLVLRDDLIGASVARQARMQQAYEDRIAALRTQVDRITSRQLLDQQLMETKVAELLKRQTELSERQGQLGPILERLGDADKESGSETLDKKASLDLRQSTSQLASAASGPVQIAALWKTRTASVSQADEADKMFLAINKSLRTIEQDQLNKLALLAEDASETAGAISEALAAAGLKIDVDYGKSDLGGPLVVADKKQIFNTRVRELDLALRRLDDVKDRARNLPIANPAPGQPITSSFGLRRDPLLGTAALHSGMDFRAKVGTPVRATAPGTVIAAGWAGGYGRMVEIAHEGGFTTRYAHLSRIGVKVGDTIERGALLGKAGSTGRSTGPHLHYEVRRNGQAVDPLRFIKAGKQVAAFL
ncbi:M23 family metallopeptidase [Tianweitania sediminis]